jgi:hypothetical protein
MKMKFYNVKTKKAVTTDKYKVVKKSGKTFAVASQAGTTMWRIMPKKK